MRDNSHVAATWPIWNASSPMPGICLSRLVRSDECEQVIKEDQGYGSQYPVYPRRNGALRRVR